MATRSRCIFLALLCLLALATPASAQSPSPERVDALRLAASQLLSTVRNEVQKPASQQSVEALFEAAMRNIAVPTLLVRGRLSDVVTEEGVQEFLRQIPDAKMVDVSGVAHMVAGDENDAFSEAVIDFLEHDIRTTLLGKR